MPHLCVKCGKLYEDGSHELLDGCSCGSKFFFYVKKENIEQAKQFAELSKKERKQIEKDIKDIISDQSPVIDESNKAIILDLESINVSKPGNYQIDLINLLSGKPLVYRIEDGKYIIDLASSFETTRKKHAND